MRAILQVADTGPVESLIYMFNSIGIKCMLPSEGLLDVFRRMGLSTIISRKTLEEAWGYSPVALNYGIATETDMLANDTLLVDVKGHVNYAPLVKRYPSLCNRILWYRINGGEPENVPNKGIEVSPPCPVITPNQWYKLDKYKSNAYAFWPRLIEHTPLNNEDPYTRVKEKIESDTLLSSYKPFLPPMALIHNIHGWGYGPLVPSLQKIGLRIYGIRGPDGVICNTEARCRLQKAIAMVHLKSSDAPGYALYEAVTFECPLIVSRRLIWRNHMQELLIPNISCLVFDRKTHDPLSPTDVEECAKEITDNLSRLTNDDLREGLTSEAKDRLAQIEWNASKVECVDSLREFIVSNFSQLARTL